MTETTAAVPRWPLQWPMGWPRTPYAKRRAPIFSTKKLTGGNLSVAIATQRLESELERLGGKTPSLSTNVGLRLDGRPRSDIEPADPGAAVYFTYKGRATVLACDRFKRVADNIAALAAHIDALRRIERYGVGSLEQALAGYKSLPADTAADWRSVFGFLPGWRGTAKELDAAYYRLARERHPDAGGTQEGFTQLGRALEYARAELEIT